MEISRRRFLGTAGALTSLALWPGPGLAAESGARMLVVLLRGGLDGLHALVPRADPAHARLRGAITPEATLPLDADFALHPALGFAYGLFRQGQLLPVVAIAPPYRERSHFEAQDCVENGSAQPGALATGWMNRCVAAMPGQRGLAISTVMPLIMRGPGNAGSWSPPLPETVNPVLLQRLQSLYPADAQLAAAFASAVDNQDMVAQRGGGGRLVQATTAAARFMGAADGPRIGFIEDSGWDTHSNQAGVLARKLAELDAGLRAFHQHSGPAWKHSVVVVVSEFGRTAAVNGTGGTDHGTGGLALLAGGAVRGGKVAGDWPGLGPAELNQGRDLRTTTDMRALFKAVLAGHLGLREASLETDVFPGSRGVKAMPGLLA